MTGRRTVARQYVAAIDQGTTSTRAMIFDRSGRPVAVAQAEHRQIYPRPGWVEHDPVEIWKRAQEAVRQALEQAGLQPAGLAAIGVANQRETTVVWERANGRPIANAVVWQDTRTDRICAELAGEEGPDRFRSRTGLPLATYFSGPKIRWLLDHVEDARDRAEAGELLFGTIDSWLIWNLTGGPEGGLHVTDVTNAGRTLLMDLDKLEWSAELLDPLGVPAAMLPEIRSSAEVYGEAGGELAGIPVAGILGDQQAALVGQACFGAGEAKNTYGTGSFLLVNTGPEPVPSASGLITTVAYQLGAQPAAYALEGSIAVTGALVQWLRDNLGIIRESGQIDELASSVEDSGGVYFVPAFSGLFAPHWDSRARGAILGLTGYAAAGHLARAALEATAWQTREVVDAMQEDSGIRLENLKVDGGMVGNQVLMQFQADVLGVPVIRPQVAETTSLGAAYAAGLAVGVWESPDELRSHWRQDREWQPQMEVEEREERYRMWKRAVSRSRAWLD